MKLSKVLRSSSILYAALGLVLVFQAGLLISGFSRYGNHPDELGARIMDLIPWDKWRPMNYYYPTTHVYLLKLVTVPLADVLHFKLNWLTQYDDLTFNRIGRLVTGLMALGSTVLIYLIGRQMGWSKGVRLITAALWATFPLQVNLGHFNTTDVPNAFWMLLALWAGFHAIAKPSNSRLIISGLVLGMAAGVKYLAILAVPGILVGLWVVLLKRENISGLLSRTAVWASMVAAGFILTTPAVILDSARFLADVQFLRHRVPVWEGADSPPGLVGIPFSILRAMNSTFLAMATFGGLFVVRHLRHPRYIVLIVNAGVYFAFMAPNHFYPQRFLLPIYVYIHLFAGTGLLALLLATRGDGIRGFAPVILGLAGLILLIPNVRNSLAVARNFRAETRYVAARWLLDNVHGDKVLLPRAIHTYFPVPFLPEHLIVDSAETSVTAALPCDLRYALTSSFYDPPAETLNAKNQAYVTGNWKVVRRFLPAVVTDKVPASMEFLCPVITVYQRPEGECVTVKSDE